MTRKEAIAALLDIGRTIAEKQGLTQMEKEVPFEGIWTGFYEAASLKYEQDFKSIILSDGKGSPIDGRRNRYVEIGYHFSNPKLCVFGRNPEGYQTLASIEIGDTVYNDETGKWEGSGNYVFRESQVWRHEGFEMLETLLDMWKERGGK